MHSCRLSDKKSPEATANFLSKLIFWWTFPIFKFGLKNQIKLESIHNAADEDLSTHLGNKLERYWNEEITSAANKRQKPSFPKALFKMFGAKYIVYSLFLFGRVVVRLTTSVVLAEYILYFDHPQSSRMKGWMLATAIVLMTFVMNVIEHYTTLQCARVGMRARIACCSLMYRKILRLGQNALDETTSGQIVNLLSNDVQRFDLATLFLPFIVIMPIQFGIAFYLGYRTVQYSMAAGMLLILIQAITTQGYLSKLVGRFRYRVAERTDQRVKLMNEVTYGIQVIKMYAWEKPFQKAVELARKLEIDEITKSSYIKGLQQSMMVFSERVALFLTLVTYVLIGNDLTGDRVFSLAQIFNLVQYYTVILFPYAVTYYSELKVSMKRIEEFLLLEEKQQLAVTSDDKHSGNVQLGKVEIAMVDASWLPDTPMFHGLSFLIPPGTLCCVIGSVGSGKSSLLQLLIGELPSVAGNLQVIGQISYASQEPWLFFSSVKDNVLFGKPYSINRYESVIDVCALKEDIAQFPYGDNTMVGERGVSLSGGQRARINLARAVYAEADIYLLDDPLSAVDAHVGKHIFHNCIKTYLQGKTRMLATHQLQFLQEADMIIVLDKGSLQYVGAFSDLSEEYLNYLKPQKGLEDQPHSPTKETTLKDSSKADVLEDKKPEDNEEEVGIGSIPASTYWEYYKCGTNLFLVILLPILLVAGQMWNNSCDMLLRYWTNNEGIKNRESISIVQNETQDLSDTLYEVEVTNFTPQYREHLIILYSILVVITMVMVICATLLYYKICMNSSKSLHKKMFSSILRAPMRFFDTNPSGRILNRFSKDMGRIDEQLPQTANNAIQIFLGSIGVIVLVCIVNIWMIVPTILLALLFYLLRVVYLSTAQDVMRLEGVFRAPVFSHTSSTLKGLSTIRSSNSQQMVIKEFDVLQDQHTSTWFLYLAIGEAFGYYLDMICTVFVMIVTYQFMLYEENTLSGNVGLIISQSLTLSGTLQFGIRQSAEWASNMISVERVLQYTKLEQEPSHVNKLKSHSKSGGEIQFKNVYLRYTEDPKPALKNLNFEIKCKEKIGIVGRTGAGKSSLIASLFRLAPIEGEIIIDGVDTSTVDLENLRSKISIIPQEPVLFSATIRYNLDPFESQDDSTLWKALENVELKNVIDDLEQKVSESGANFSAGQRQLICLARAIVRNNRILVMDEATANVDHHTDALIQRTIRKNFGECTVLTIAHRLNTIMDSDKVLVMDYGEAVEFDHPHKLLQDPDGFFSRMVQETGTNMCNVLKEIAENDYNKRLDAQPEITYL